MPRPPSALPLIAISGNELLVMSAVKTDEPLSLVSLPGVIQGVDNDVPYMYFCEHQRGSTEELQNTIVSLVKHIDVRNKLKKGYYTERDNAWDVISSYNRLVRNFQNHLNSWITEDIRNKLYKATMSNVSLLNIDGVMFHVRRKRGTTHIVNLSMPETKRCMLAWEGVVDEFGLFSRNKQWVDYAIDKNLEKFPQIKQLYWKRWPEGLKPIDIDYYTGFRQRKDKKTAEVV